MVQVKAVDTYWVVKCDKMYQLKSSTELILAWACFTRWVKDAIL